CALLAVNNLRDIPTDAAAGKRTLAVRLGDARARELYLVLISGAFALAIVAALVWRWEALFTLLAIALAVPPVRAVRAGAGGRALIAVLVQTGRLQLVYGVLATLGLALGG